MKFRADEIKLFHSNALINKMLIDVLLTIDKYVNISNNESFFDHTLLFNRTICNMMRIHTNMFIRSLIKICKV